MKKNYISLAILIGLLVGKTLAQPILTDANTSPVVGDVYNWVNSDFPTSTGSSGVNQTWDYSSLVATNSYTENAVSPSSTSTGTYFQSSNVSLDNGGIDSYFQTFPDSLLNEGGGSFSWHNTYSDPEKYLTYPFTYNSSFIDHYISSFDNAGSISSIVGTDTVTADAYGTLQLPFGNLTNALRVKMVENYIQTYMGNNVSHSIVTYSWYLPGTHQPVLILKSYSNGSNLAKYLVTSIGISDNKGFANISLYPNPATDRIFIETKNSNGDCTVSLYNTQGQELIKQQITGTKTQINIDDLPTGVYIIKLVGDNLVEVRKVIKK